MTGESVLYTAPSSSVREVEGRCSKATQVAQAQVMLVQREVDHKSVAVHDPRSWLKPKVKHNPYKTNVIAFWRPQLFSFNYLTYMGCLLDSLRWQHSSQFQPAEWSFFKLNLKFSGSSNTYNLTLIIARLCCPLRPPYSWTNEKNYQRRQHSNDNECSEKENLRCSKVVQSKQIVRFVRSRDERITRTTTTQSNSTRRRIFIRRISIRAFPWRS